MSPSIWTRCAATSEPPESDPVQTDRGSALLAPWRGGAWRVVEAQHLVGTRALVDDAEEQSLLESLIDDAKPPRPVGAAVERLHYLLYTPFRYPPLRHGSRFGTRAERGIWYGSETLPTAFAEVAYYRLVFLDGTAADLTPLVAELTAFRVALQSERAVDLTADPFGAWETLISAPDRYDAAQELGRDMRAAGVALFRYRSARDRNPDEDARTTGGGVNIGVFEAAAIQSRRPTGLQAWLCVASREGVELSRKGYFDRGRFDFPRSGFLVDGRLPAPAL